MRLSVTTKDDEGGSKGPDISEASEVSGENNKP